MGGGAKAEGKKQKRKREEVGRRQREHSSELCNLQRPFLPTFLLIAPMQTQCSSLTIPSTLSK